MNSSSHKRTGEAIVKHHDSSRTTKPSEPPRANAPLCPQTKTKCPFLGEKNASRPPQAATPATHLARALTQGLRLKPNDALVQLLGKPGDQGSIQALTSWVERHYPDMEGEEPRDQYLALSRKLAEELQELSAPTHAW